MPHRAIISSRPSGWLGGVPGSSPRKAHRVFRAFGTSGHGADAVLREKPYLLFCFFGP
jgi:hypothetical protein